jgi:single-strand DNA-binding protein
MNRVEIIGRLTRDAELKSSTSGTSYYRNGIAVDRKGKDAGTDFFNLLAFNKTAEFLDKYFRKGSKIAISGHLQSGEYTKQDGTKVTTVEIVVEECDFCESKSESNPTQNAPQSTKNDFLNVPDGLVEELPFA